MISKEELLELSEIHATNCVSIYIPTHRAGQEVLQGKDALNLKNQLKQIKSKMEHDGMNVNDIETFIEPINDLISDGEFWRHQSDGLAIFLSDGLFRKYTLPVYFEEFNYLSNEFYLKPVIPLFNGDGLFYLLTLKKDQVKFYECTRHSFTQIKIDDLVPSRLEESVGYDYEQKGLQFRTQQGNRGVGSFHGHVDQDSNEKKELVEFFRGVDKGLMDILSDDQNPPLVVSCVDYYFPIYQKVNSYKNLFPQHIPGNPKDKDIALLHEEAWSLLDSDFDRARQEKLDICAEHIGTEKASAEIEDILPAAFDGRVDTLFLENRADIFGIYNPVARKVRIEEVDQSPNVSLMNLLAMRVLKNGGTVYLLEKEKLPVQSSKMCALFRY
jgi:hypothetical protein